MRADRRLAVLHENHLLHLREVVQSMRNQENDLILGVCLQIRKHSVLRLAVKRGKRVVQNKNGLLMAERPCKRQPLCLAAGESYAAISHKSLYATRHLPDFLIQAAQT